MPRDKDYWRFHSRPPGDEPGGIDRVLASLGLPPLLIPRWATMALRRNEQVEGRWIDTRLRWYFTCTKCCKDVFIIHPYIPPALEELIPHGGVSDKETLETPVNDVKLHPCPIEWVTVGWDGLETRNLENLLHGP